MYEERYAKAISLGYKFLEEDDNGGAVYVKNGLKWIENYADLAEKLEEEQKEPLSFEDLEYKYGYHIDDYFFYNFNGGDEHPDNISLERQIKWINANLANFVNIFTENVNEEILKGRDYKSYKIVNSESIPYVLLVYDEKDGDELYTILDNSTQFVKISIKRALAQGYQYKKSDNYSSKYPFMFRESDNTKWIHTIDGLISRLGINSLGGLITEGYNVDDYYEYNNDDVNDPRYLEWKERKDLLSQITQQVLDLVEQPQPTKDQVTYILDCYIQKQYPKVKFYGCQLKNIVLDIMIRKYEKLFPIEEDSLIFDLELQYLQYLRKKNLAPKLKLDDI